METGLAKSNVVIDNTFIPQDSGIYQLLIHFDGDVLSYGVLDPGTHVFIVLGKTYKEDSNAVISFLQEEFKSNDILKLEYKNAFFTISGIPNTLVPTAFFEKEKAKELLNFTSGDQNDSIDFTTISKLKATIVHKNDGQISSIFLDKHPYGKVFLNSGLLIETLLRVNRYDTSEKVYVNVRKQSFDLFVLRKGKLLLYNQFDYETPNDLLYHVLNTVQQIEIDVKKVGVLISGEIRKEDKHYSLMAEYIKNIQLNKGLDDYEFGLQLNNIEAHQYMSLLNLSVCV